MGELSQRWQVWFLGRFHSLFLRSKLLQRAYCWAELRRGKAALAAGNCFRGLEYVCAASRRVQINSASRARAQQVLQPYFRRGPNAALKSFLASSACAQYRARFAAYSFPENVTLKGALLPLKAPNPATREKGVLLLTYNERFRAFHAVFDTEKLKQHYCVVLEPADDRIEDPGYTLYTDWDTVILAGNPRIRHGLDVLGSGFAAAPLSSSDWVDSDLFRPLPNCEKRYDIIYVANWSLNKRHHLLFAALAKMSPALKVALVGFRWERSRSAMEAEMRKYGVARQCEIFESVPAEQVNALLNASRVNLLLSRREGGNRALYEAMFAGVPNVVVRSCQGVDPACINSLTGNFAEEDNLHQTIAEVLQTSAQFRPRDWALAHSGYAHSTKILNHALRALILLQNGSWVTDIAAKTNRPNLSYKFPADADRLRPVLEHLASFRRK